jgi:hypothetical protein
MPKSRRRGSRRRWISKRYSLRRRWPSYLILLILCATSVAILVLSVNYGDSSEHHAQVQPPAATPAVMR